ncbi:MAG: M15 family metallopeptidase [Gammaproteobacteria bacterium]|nr:M15 family metallopeptidase [Gammaproteobacteria bacterium]
MKKLCNILLVLFMLFATCCSKNSGLVNILDINNNIIIDLKYATKDNFLHKNIYQSTEAKLLKDVADALDKAQEEFKTHGVGLKVWDAYRPLEAQKAMWATLPDERYVANPAMGGRHTRGTAVDVTLIDLATNQELAMPTEFDNFTEKAHREYSYLDSKIKANVELLESIMHKHGFIGLPTEWWHFDYHDWESRPVIVD